MFELTAMRLAKRALDQRTQGSTLEDLTKNNIDVLQKQLLTSDPKSDMQNQIISAYETFGKPGDLKTAEQHFGEDGAKAVELSGHACYFDKNGPNRFTNNETSAYIMAVTVGEPNSGLTEADAATVWIVERARQEAESHDPAHYAIGKSNGNLLNISTRVARYLGRIAQAKDSSADEMESLIQEQEKQLNAIISSAYAQVKDSLKSCLSDKTECATCAEAIDRYSKFDSGNAGFDKIQSGLLETIARSDNLKIEKDLKGKMGETVFDFSNFAKGSVAKWVPSSPPRTLKDACGDRLRQQAAAKKKGNKPADPTDGTAPTTAPVTGPAPATVPAASGNAPAIPAAVTVPVAAVAPTTAGTRTTAATNVPVTAKVVQTAPATAPATEAAPQQAVVAPKIATTTTTATTPDANRKPSAGGMVFKKASFDEFNTQLQSQDKVELGACSAQIVTIEGKQVFRGQKGNMTEQIEMTDPDKTDKLNAFYQDCNPSQ